MGCHRVKLKHLSGTLAATLLLWTVQELGCSAMVLTPPDMNLAAMSGSRISATSACGVSDSGQPVKEWYCSLGGANQYNPFMSHYLSVNADHSLRHSTAAPDGGFAELRMASSDQRSLQHGYNCDICYGNDSHPATAMTDGSPSWWMSPPLSRGSKYKEVNITINLNQEFQVAYVWIQMANSPRPAAWVLERSTDHGETWLPWQYFAETESQCEELFGAESLQPILDDDSVICTKEYSKIVPIENGEIYVRLLQDRPSRFNFTHSALLQNFTKATDVRIRIFKMKTIGADLMGFAQQDPTVTRRYFYAIKEIYMGGRCQCHGHADTCDVLDPARPDLLLCRCKHNTMGDLCDQCKPGYDQKPWRPAKDGDPFVCEPCNCFGHSENCQYDPEIDRLNKSMDRNGNYEGGGVCSNCRDNTEGINCHECAFGYFRPEGRPRDAINVCEPCDCDPHFHSGDCLDETAVCLCNERFVGPDCSECAHGYYNWSDCTPCDCHLNGTIDEQCLPSEDTDKCPCLSNYAGTFCDDCADGFYNVSAGCIDCVCSDVGSDSNDCNTTTGQCPCKSNFAGLECQQCAVGYYDHPECKNCDCDLSGTEPEVCNNQTGQCVCKPGFAGDRCDKCNATYYGYPNCKPCECDDNGAASAECEQSTGACQCHANFTSRTCNKCSTGYYAFPDCHPCECYKMGSSGITCDDRGVCYCRANFMGDKCNRCLPERYNFPLCEECNCNPDGTVADFAGCDQVPEGELCTCRPNVQGRTCDTCKPTTWNLQRYNPDGCEDCACSPDGSVSTLNECHVKTGQCFCRPNVHSSRCDQCRPGYYQLQQYNPFGCQACVCNAGGSETHVCDQVSGQCRCRRGVTGLSCDTTDDMYYAPTLWHITLEAEDGRTPDTAQPVRYSSNDEAFNNFSSRGFMVFSTIQPEEVLLVNVPRSSVYRLLLHYVNPTQVPALLNLTMQPLSDASSDAVTQTRETSLAPSPDAQGQTVPVQSTDRAQPSNSFLLTSGPWNLRLSTEQRLLLDYVVLMPSEYYNPSSLRQPVAHECTALPHNTSICLQVSYPPLPITDDIAQFQPEFVNHITEEPVPDLPDDKFPVTEDRPRLAHIMAPPQPNVSFDIPIPEPGKQHVVVFTYYSLLPGSVKVDVSARDDVSADNATVAGVLNVNSCPYKALCRDVLIDAASRRPLFVDTQEDSEKLHMLLGTEAPLADFAIAAVHAIPVDKWQPQLLVAQEKCMSKDGVCVSQSFAVPEDGVVVEAESSDTAGNSTFAGDELPFDVHDPDTTVLVALGKDLPSIHVHKQAEQPNWYYAVVDYYNPYNGDVTVPAVIRNDKRTKGCGAQASYPTANITFAHCANAAGCRVRVDKLGDERNVFHVAQQFDIEILPPTGDGLQPVYVDKITAVPHSAWSDDIFKRLPVDVSDRFLTECSEEHFKNHADSVSDFCKSQVFALTVGFNEAAVPCDCNTHGSANSNCAKYGGQCECRENIIGRTCDKCRPGFYGFPECKPCDCQKGEQCDERTGQCTCPQLVIGRACDTCDERAYGYDALIGCQLCGCSVEGSRDGRVKCNDTTGQCVCKDTVGGRRCDQCLNGYYSFPSCAECACERAGTTAQVCDKRTAQCTCKASVLGAQCDSCSDGTFNLEASNEAGCSDCYCFGTTTACRSTDKRVHKLTSLAGWTSNVAEADIETTEQAVTLSAETPLDRDDVYLVAPDTFTGKQILSYGGYIALTIASSPGESESPSQRPDLRITGGNNLTIEHWNAEPPADAKQPFTVKVRLQPHAWRLLDGAAPSREQMMLILHSIDSILVKASHYASFKSAALSSFTLDSAIDPNDVQADPEAPVASSVEQCGCPPPYTGTSCELCASGYYRVNNTGSSSLGACVPCDCNYHTEQCDPHTGLCLNCIHDTIGDHCEQCAVGFYGDATQGTQYDCLRCPCPIPSANNSFADSCEVNTFGQLTRCECHEGYAGASCDRCEIGWFGQPTEVDGKCRPCDCSGNADLTVRENCEERSGVCNNCENLSGGDNCEVCQQWYWGDAVEQKNCTECNCDKCGSNWCDFMTGECTCKPQVTGDQCDRCEADHWGFRQCSVEGCRPCNCAEASLNTQCNDTSGQCPCKTGVTGLTCDRCDKGYFNYSASGCGLCDCEAALSEPGTVCDPWTGQCQCQPGATGPRCDQCLTGYLRIPTLGCKQCDECVHVLKDDLDDMQQRLDGAVDYINSVSSSALTKVRLGKCIQQHANMSDQLEALREMQSADEQEGLANVVASGNQAAAQATELFIKANRSFEQISDAKNRSANILDDGSKQKIDAVSAKAQKVIAIVDGVRQLSQSLTEGASLADRGRMVAEAQAIMDALRNGTFEDDLKVIEEEKAAAQELLDLVKTNFTDPTDGNKAVLDKLEQTMKRVQEYTAASEDISTKTQQTIDKAQQITNDTKMKLYKDTVDDIDGKVENSNKGSDWVKQRVDDATQALSTKHEPDQIRALMAEVNETMWKVHDATDELLDELPELRVLPIDADARAQTLTASAAQLSDQFAGAQTASQQAVEAAGAYERIVEALNEADEAAELARQAADKTKEKPSDVIEETEKAVAESMEILRQASDSRADVSNQVAGTLKQLEARIAQANDDVNTVDADRQEKYKVLADMIAAQQSDQLSSLEESAKQITERANKVSEEVKAEQSKLEELSLESADAVDDTAAAGLDLSATRNNIDKVRSLLPNMTELLEEAEASNRNATAAINAVDSRLSQLKRKIALARDNANRINVGIKMQADSALQVTNPADITQSKAKTTMSLYFKTDQNDGFLFFLGNEKGTAQAAGGRAIFSDDFLAVELRAGNPVVVVNLGMPEASELKSDQYVSDGRWHGLKVERVGRALTLTVISDGSQAKPVSTAVSSSIAGDKQVLDLHADYSRIYVGGLPDAARMPGAVRSRHLVGHIEDVWLNGDPLGLWHFEQQTNVEGAEQRTELRKSDDNTGVTLNGNGYVVMNIRDWRPLKQGRVQLIFRSHAKNGLMFFVGKTPDLLSIELNDGHVVAQLNQGSGTGQVRSVDTYNDGKWHMVVVSKDEKQLSLTVDKEEPVTGESPGTHFELQVDALYMVGGLPAYVKTSISANGFSGCVDNLKLDDRPVNLNYEGDVREAKGVEGGCPDTSVRVVSAYEAGATDLQPRVTLQNLSVDTDVELSLRFKTKSLDAHLFTLASNSDDQLLSLSLTAGVLNLVSRSAADEQATVQLELSDAGDSRWHYATVLRSGNTLRLAADDLWKAEVPHTHTGYSPVTATLTFMAPEDEDGAHLLGCLADPSLNAELLDFATATVSGRVSMVGCPIEDPRLSSEQTETQENKQRHTLHMLQPLGGIKSVPNTFARAESECALSTRPIGSREDSVGWRFGMQPGTLWHFDTLPHAFDAEGTFGIEFRATAANGVMFFATNQQNTDHLAVYLRNGHVVFSFSAGSGTASIVSPDAYHDSEWHTVSARRSARQGWLSVDGRQVAEGSSAGSSNAVDTTPPFYVGAIPAHLVHVTRRMLPDMFPAFSGCLRHLRLNSQPVEPKANETQLSGVVPCGTYTEEGVYFGQMGGYAIVDKQLMPEDVGVQFSIELEVKPRVSTAVLLAIQGGSGDYLSMQLLDGQLVFTVDNGAGAEVLRFEPDHSRQLCDGHWHHIKIYKAKFVMTVAVDGRTAPVHLLKHRASTQTNTNSPLYLGGVPDSFDTSILQTTERLVGCVRALRFSPTSSRIRKRVVLPHLQMHGDVGKQECPVN